MKEGRKEKVERKRKGKYQWSSYRPTDPARQGGEGSRGPFAPLGKNVALVSSSTDHLVLIQTYAGA